MRRSPGHAIPDASVTLHVNGAVHRLVVETRATLLDVLRERIGSFSTKKGGDPGAVWRLHRAS